MKTSSFQPIGNEKGIGAGAKFRAAINDSFKELYSRIESLEKQVQSLTVAARTGRKPMQSLKDQLRATVAPLLKDEFNNRRR